MNSLSINNSSSSGIPTSGCASDASRRQSLLLASRSTLQTQLPQAVRDYFNGQWPDDPAAVAQWCCDTGEQAVLGELEAKEFQGSVVVSRLDEIAGRAAERGFELKLRLEGEVDPTNMDKLTDFLEKHPLKVTELSLNLSAEIQCLLVPRLIRAVDALPNLATLEVRVGGRSKAPEFWQGRPVLASSRACMTLSAAARAIVFGHDMSQRAKVEAYEAGAQELQEEAELLRGMADESLLDQESSSWEVNSYVERTRMRAAGLSDEAAARRLAPAALAAFFSMEKCPDTGDPIKSEFADALARLARYLMSSHLLRAVHALAPNYVMTLREEMPHEYAISHLERGGVPCHLQHCIVPTLLADDASFLYSLWELQPVSLDLKVVEHLDEDGTKHLLTNIAQLERIRDFAFTIAPGIDVDITSVEKRPNFSSQASSLTLNGSKSDPNRHETRLLAMFLDGFRPQSLSLGLTTSSGAAALLGLAPLPGGLEHLSITCDTPGVPQGPSLVEVVERMLLECPALSNILIRSHEVLLTSADEIARFRRQARAKPRSGDIRIEHLSLSTGGWQCYFHENFLLSEMAAAFVSQHLGLPPDVGVHMVDNIGGLSADDISNLRGVSPAMNSAWERLSRE